MEAGIPFVLVYLGAVLNMVRRGERPDAAGMQRVSHLLCSCVGPGLSLHGSCTTVLQKRLLCKRVYGVSAGLPVLWQCYRESLTVNGPQPVPQTQMAGPWVEVEKSRAFSGGCARCWQC